MSLMSKKMLDDLFPEYTLQPCSLPMQTYLGEPITVVGQVQVEVRYGEQQETLPLVVVEGSGPCLFWTTVADKDTFELAVYQQRQEQPLIARHLGSTPRSLQNRAGHVERIQSPDFS